MHSHLSLFAGLVQRYHPYGFEIIGIHTPEFAFDQNPKLVAQGAKFFGLSYPILNDPNSVNWNLYNEKYWPSKYLFDQNGHLVEQHPGEGNYRETELTIQRLLKRTYPNVKFPAPLAYQEPGDAPNAVCREDTPELYANPTRGFLGNLPSGWKQDRVTSFKDGTPKRVDKIYAQGPFYTRYQSLQHARATKDLADGIALRYRGTEVNVVLNRPEGKDYRVYAAVDGKPIPAELQGGDVHRDARGTYLEVNFARMYNVIHGPYGEHTLRLASDSPEFDLYSFTFSGCTLGQRRVAGL